MEMGNAKVSIEKAGNDLVGNVKKAIQNADCNAIISAGDSVLIKPNLNGCSVKGSTSISLIKAIAQSVYDMGAREVIIGEGPVHVGRERLDKYFRDIGIMEAAREVGASFVNFDDYGHVIHKNISEHLPEEIGISEFVYEADKIINVPMLKVHPSTVVTLSMKNLKGCTRPQDKTRFHRMDLQRAIVELNKLVRPHINIIDGIKAMQGTDHNGGDIVDLGLIFCSKDIIAVDSIASYIIGIQPEDIRLIKLGNEAGLGECDLSKIDVRGEDLENNRRKFELPEEAMSRRFPGLAILKNSACSACLANLMDALGWAGGHRKFDAIVLGNHMPEADNSILIGNCTRKHWANYTHVKGCPPTSMEIAKAISMNSLSGTIFVDD